MTETHTTAHIPDEAVVAMPERIYAAKSDRHCIISMDEKFRDYDVEYVRADIATAQTIAPVTKPVDVSAGLEQAANFLEQRVHDYVQEHGMTDPSTGVVEYPGWGDEYVSELEDLAEAIRALSAEPVQGEQWQPTHRHVKRGTDYEVLGIGKMQTERWIEPGIYPKPGIADMREVVVYRSVDDGSLWVRPIEEFNDGRFEVLPATPTSEVGR